MAKREGLFITEALRKLFEAEGELREQLGIEANKFFAEWEADKENEALRWTSMKVPLRRQPEDCGATSSLANHWAKWQALLLRDGAV